MENGNGLGWLCVENGDQKIVRIQPLANSPCHSVKFKHIPWAFLSLLEKSFATDDVKRRKDSSHREPGLIRCEVDAGAGSAAESKDEPHRIGVRIWAQVALRIERVRGGV